MSEQPIEQLLQVMRRLRDPQHGCPWDLQQTYASLAPYTLEEACEVVDTLERGDLDSLRDELGDLLFQVVFLAQLASEQGRFNFADVAAGISDKLVRRHPHVFGNETQGGDINARWEALKAGERQQRGQTGVLADVPQSLPALSRAAKLGRRAARVGFDWSDAAGARAKVFEEIAELDAAVAANDADNMAEELGDLLMAVSSWSRQLQLDPEACLRRSNRKLERRFAAMEQSAAVQGLALESLSAEAWETLWQQAKRSLPAAGDDC
jgi:ATP diphosphatase